MPQYLVAIQHPNNYDPSLEGEAMIRDIGALNEERSRGDAKPSSPAGFLSRCERS